MNSLRHDMDAMESEAYAVIDRREVNATRPPRRESPRFNRRTASASGIGGAHQRRNKRSGL